MLSHGVSVREAVGHEGKISAEPDQHGSRGAAPAASPEAQPNYSLGGSPRSPTDSWPGAWWGAWPWVQSGSLLLAIHQLLNN